MLTPYMNMKYARLTDRCLKRGERSADRPYIRGFQDVNAINCDLTTDYPNIGLCIWHADFGIGIKVILILAGCRRELMSRDSFPLSGPPTIFQQHYSQ